MITEIDFKVKGEEWKKQAYAIGELLETPVKYTKTSKFDYLIGSGYTAVGKMAVRSSCCTDLSQQGAELMQQTFWTAFGDIWKPMVTREITRYPASNGDPVGHIIRRYFVDMIPKGKQLDYNQPVV